MQVLGYTWPPRLYPGAHEIDLEIVSMKHLSPVRILAVLILMTGITACETTGIGRATDLELSDEPLAGKFVWHDLMTDDVQAARRFYGGLFGWTFENTTGPAGGDYTLITSGSHLVGGMVQLADPSGEDYSRWLGYLSVPDVDEAVELARSAGGGAVVGPLDLPNIGRAAAILDPQGAVVGLLRSDIGDPVDRDVYQAGRVVWNELLAKDDLGAAEFYSKASGARIKLAERSGGRYVYLQAQDRDRAGIMARPADDIEPFWLTHFAVEDPVAAARLAAELGGQVLLEPSSELRGGSLAVVSDPTGAILALHRWPEAAGGGE